MKYPSWISGKTAESAVIAPLRIAWIRNCTRSGQEAFYAYNGPVDSEAQVWQAPELFTDEKMELLKLFEQSSELVAVLKSMMSKK